MKIPIIAWIFQVLPESIALSALVISMGTGRLPWQRVLKIGVTYAICVYFIRLLPFTPGVHVIVLSAILGTLCIFLGKLEMKRALILSAMGVAVLVLAEFIAVYILTSFGFFDISKMNENLFTRILFGYPHTIIIFVLALLFARRKLNIGFIFNKDTRGIFK